MFPREILPAPRECAERFFPRLVYWNEPRAGGHFAVFEEPELFVRECADSGGREITLGEMRC